MGSQVITFDGTNAPTSTMGPADGDSPIAGADVVPGIQAAGDTAWNALLRVRPLVGLADLRAITTPTDGLTRYVLGYGVFTFKTISPVSTNVEPWCVAPTDGTTGFWVADKLLERRKNRTIGLVSPYGITPTAISWSTANQALSDATSPDVERTSTGVRFTSTPVVVSALGRQMYFRLDEHLEHGTRIVNAQLSILPATHGALPGSPPRFTLARFPLDPWDPNLTSLISAGFYSDASHVAVATYNAAHEFGGVVDQNHDVDLYEYAYVLVVANEGGANALAGLKLGALELQLI
jgi:hypothetical protein